MKAFLTLAMLMAMNIQLNAQTFAKNYKVESNGNPISSCVFCADPTALEYHGRLYVYGTNDHQSFIKRGKKGGIDYGDVKSLVIFSTDDMVNWTFHGTIDTQKLCSSWKKVTSWDDIPFAFHNSWAPSVVWRTNDKGEDEFFLYFANNSHGVGVLKASSPIGPWKSPLTTPLINNKTPGALPNSANFDPGVVIDDNGTGWITFGGLDPETGGTDLQPNTTRIAKLKPSMTALDGAAIQIPAPYHFEANELNMIGGKYVFTYCSNWAERKDADWNAYKREQGIDYSKPDLCTMCYMVSDNPTDPNSWKYKGVYGKHPGFPSPNNHSHLHKFQGNYYYIYHWGALMKKMLDERAIDSSSDGYRSICVNKATVDEEKQKMSTVTLNMTGVSPIKKLNPFELQQAETIATSGGINYEDFKNISSNTAISTLGNDASRNMQVKMVSGAWIMVRNVDFGQTGAKSFVFKAKGTGKVEIHFTKSDQPAATLEFSSSSMQDHVLEIDPAKFQGTKNQVFFLFTKASNVQFDAWQFFETELSAITPVSNTESQTSALYDLNGHRLSGAHSGLVIEQYQDANGTICARKRVK